MEGKDVEQKAWKSIAEELRAKRKSYGWECCVTMQKRKEGVRGCACAHIKI